MSVRPAPPQPVHSPAELNLAIVCFPSLGGSGIIATELALGLSQRGHRVHVIASAPPTRTLPACSRLLFHEVTAPRYPVFDHEPYTLALSSRIFELASEQPLDLLHVHYAVPHAASAYLARQALGARAPALVTTLHGTDVTHLGADPAYRAITRFCVEASDAISVPSEYLRGQAIDVLGLLPTTPIDVIPNFVDTEHFAPPQTREPARLNELFDLDPSAPPAPTLFHVSNFRAVKRVTDLLEVLARVRTHVPARLILVGDGPDRAAAAQRARELGLQAHVRLLGKQTEFVPYLQAADVFLLTSESESFGLAALEALSCGVPVVGYAVGGVPSVVSQEVGRLVAPFDVDALAAATLSILADPELRARLSGAARARVLACFRAQPALDRYERLFARALAAHTERHP